ncbi:hypothetical protein MUK42_32620 [Musa troglodytarum]|uniref:Uncharacterized protein n=1 Tax=Musa troglodytarum TaxID=320322 RepID=A0A9E7FEQ8_9LILI|nr:hypothetical protein MUK42_32620 [Musa troglodytarum]
MKRIPCESSDRSPALFKRSMEKILERYERYCYAEKAIACSDPGPQTQIMLDSVAELQRKLMEKQKLMAPSHQAQRQQQNQLPSSSSSPPSFPISGLMAESNPLPSIGTFRGRGSVDGDAAAQTQVRNTSNLLPPMDAWPSEWLTSIYDLKL